MPIQKNLNVSPYYDDFDPKKNFYKVLYKAGFPVQARELTTSQSILQDQVEKLASRILREGDNVVPGEFSMANPAPYVRLSSYTRGTNLLDYVGYEAKGVTSGVVASINFAVVENDEEDATLYVQYKTSGENGEDRTFIEGETLEINNDDNYTAVVGINEESKPISSPPMGLGTLFNVKGGSYFIDGFIVRNDEQTITLDKYGTEPTFRVGFLVSEEIVTASEDPSLLDNAQGSNNFAAPGADRLKIELTLAARTEDDADPNFVLLADIAQGEIIGNGEGETVKWDWLYDILARRTDDESGDYIVKDFKVYPYEYPRDVDGAVKGRFDPVEVEDDDDVYYPAVPGSDSDALLTSDEAWAKYALRVSPGKAYVNGYPVDYANGFWLYGDKARDEEFIDDQLVAVGSGQSITISNVNGMPDVQNLSGDGTTRAFDAIELYRNFTDGHVGQSTSASGRPLNIGNAPWKTYHIIADGTLSGTLTVGGVAVNVVYQEGRSAVVNSQNAITRGTSIAGRTVLVALEINPVVAGVIRPRHMMPDSLVDTQDGFFGYNSTFNLGLLDSEFFTDIAIVDVRGGQLDWVVGDIVEGENSGATGVVEASSTGKRLLLSDVQGEFEENEQVRQGSKVSRIIREGEIVGFQFTDKGTNNNTVDLSSQTSLEISAIGSTITLSVSGGDIVTFSDRIEITNAGRNKLRNFPYPEGSELNQRLNYTVKTNGGVNGYGVTQTPIISGTSTLSKAFYSSLADTNDFSADIAIQRSNDITTISVAGSSTFKGNANENFVTCNSIWGNPAAKLVEGDLVTFVDTAGVEVTKIVAFATKPVGYGELRAKAVIYFTTALANDVVSAGVEVIRLKTVSNSDDNFLMQLPAEVVKTLETKPENTDIEYQIFREFVVNAGVGASEVSITTTNTNEQFMSLGDYTTVTVAKNVSSPADPADLEGRILNVAIDTTQDSGKKAVYTFDSPLTDTLTLKITAPLAVTNAKAKRKIIHYDEVLNVSEADAQNEYISLGRADVLSIKDIILDPDGRNINITKEYEFDNGQRDNMYDIAKVKRRVGKVPPNGPVRITYDYFEHSGEGDFFSVDSYTSDDGVGFEAVPWYTSATGFGGVKGSRRDPIYVNLRNCIDFRPVVNDTGSNPSVYPRITAGKTSLNGTNFVGTVGGGDAFVPRMPIPQSNFACDMTVYLGRYDSVFLDQSGALSIVKGEPDVEPVPTGDISTGIRLYDMYLPPYTFTMKGVDPIKFSYKRYTMEDISGLDRRIQRVEEMVTLNMLEQSAINMEVKDAETGLDRFKNGIITDSFVDHSRGDTVNERYQSSIDPALGILRPPTYSDQVTMEDEKMTAADRKSFGYANNDGIMTLDFDSVRWMQNPVATRYINLQPYSVFTYEGTLKLTPSIDTWVDTKRQPDLVIKDETAYNAMRDMSAQMQRLGIGTVWGDWKKGKKTVKTSTKDVRGVPRSRGGDGHHDEVEAALANLRAQGWRGQVTALSGKARDTERFQNRFNRGNSAPIKIVTKTENQQWIKRGTQSTINVGTQQITKTSYGDRVTNVAISPTMRSRIVYFQAYRLKPDTRYYAFFDDVEVSAWISVDSMATDEDGDKYYRGRPNQYRKGFGYSIMSDSRGTITGCFLVPNGRAPKVGQKYTGSVRRLSYYTSGRNLRFNTGESTLKFTTSDTNSSDLELVDGFCEAEFTSSGIVQSKQETVVSTRVPKITGRKVNLSQTKVTQKVSHEAYYYDPVAQTFQVSATGGSDEGVFLTELDAFFKTKDERESVEAYLCTTDGQVPTETILPHSEVTLNSHSTLRVRCSKLVGNSAVLPANSTVVGKTSGATGVLRSTRTFQSAAANRTRNVGNFVYDVFLKNYKGQFLPGEQLIVKASPANRSTFFIANNEVVINRIDLSAVGTGYTNATVRFSPPQLPGGVAATGTCKVGNGIVYEVTLDDPGSGYTKAPTVTINGDGSGARAVARFEESEDAVEMGVCTSEDATAATKFKFKAPVYLRPGEWYAFVLKAPTSLNYNAYTAKMGENVLGTNRRLTSQTNKGSLFKSQNGGLWTEDQTQDVKFVLHRAKFVANRPAEIQLQNEPIEMKEVESDPIQVDADGNDPNSNVFGDNPQIVQVAMPNCGLQPNDLVAIEGVSSDIGGIPAAELNTVHVVVNSDFHSFTIKVNSSATETTVGGGDAVAISYNIPFEVSTAESGIMNFPSTRVRFAQQNTRAAGNSWNTLRKREFLDPVNDLAGQNFRNDYIDPGVKGIDPIIKDKFYQNAYEVESQKGVPIDEDKYWRTPKQVANGLNEAYYENEMGGKKSLGLDIFLATSNSYVSPVVDLDRTNVTLTKNLIDNPKRDEERFGVNYKTITFEGDISSAGLAVGDLISFQRGKEPDETYTVTVKRVDVSSGQVDVKGRNIYKIQLPEQDTTTFDNAVLQAAGIETVSLELGNSFRPMTDPLDSCSAQWITRLFEFENPCDGVDLKLSTYQKFRHDIRVFYRPRPVGFTGDLSTQKWKGLAGRQGMPNDWKELDFAGDRKVNPEDIQPEEWTSVTWKFQDRAKFDAVQFKIVMRQINPCYAPMISDMQVIVSE